MNISLDLSIIIKANNTYSLEHMFNMKVKKNVQSQPQRIAGKLLLEPPWAFLLDFVLLDSIIFLFISDLLLLPSFKITYHILLVLIRCFHADVYRQHWQECNETIFSLNFHALRQSLALVWILKEEETGKEAAVVLTFAKFNRHKVVWLFHFFFFAIHFIKQSQMTYILRITRNETNFFKHLHIGHYGRNFSLVFLSATNN